MCEHGRLLTRSQHKSKNEIFIIIIIILQKKTKKKKNVWFSS
jgi:hypothetical protein